TESNSIGSQRDLIRSFIKDNTDMQIYDIYIDDGCSGSNFDRPEFKRMMNDVNEGSVNCVIVKDLSRFGRDYIEAGRFIQKIFPALSVRFIAITDDYDSLTADSTSSSLVLPVKNFVNDSYCRDISQKVRSHQKIKRANGEFIGAFATYGYNKNPENKNQLIVDDYARGIVCNIYEWKLLGMSLGAIAGKLNMLAILSPSEYKKSQGMKYRTGFEKGSAALWSAVAVKRILSNQVYIGTLEQGKQEKINHKVNKRIDKLPQEWVRVENTHEAIIKAKDFGRIQELLKYDGRASKDTNVGNLFTGILFCGDCKAPMIKRSNKYKGIETVYYICQTKNKSQGCTRHSVKEEQLKVIILKEIKAFLSCMVDFEEIVSTLSDLEVNFDQIMEWDTQIAASQKEYNKYYGLKAGLYDDLKEGLINKTEFDNFHRLYSDKCDALEQKNKKQKALIKQMFKNGVSAGVQIESMKKSIDLEQLDRTLLVSMVEKIWIYEDKRIMIDFCYQSELRTLQMLKDFKESHSELRKVV
ncbi:MAG: recombinase family protein, partial [Eubacteriales bacterium]